MFSTIDRVFAINRALDNTFMTREWVPSLDVAEREEAYVISLEIPGVDPSTVDITFEQNVLSLKGEKDADKFHRAVRLPAFVDAEGISADAKHGVLTVTVPKAQSAKARKIRLTGMESKQIG